VTVRAGPTAPVVAGCLGLAAANGARAPVLALAGVAAAALVGAVSPHRRASLVLLAVALAGWWWGSARLDALGVSPLEGEIGHSGEVVAVVTGPPRASTFAIRVSAEVRHYRARTIRERVLLELPLGRSPPQGAVLALRATVTAPRGPADGFDERGWLERRGVHVVLRGGEWRIVGRRGGIGGVSDRLRAHVAGAIAPALAGERRAVLAGIVLGADEGLDQGLQDDFKASGLYHLLAVSGQNITYLALGVLGLAWLLGIPRVVAQVVAIVAIVGYVLAVGWQPSVVRAGIAGGLASLAWLLSRPRDRWHFLALGALVLLAWTPATLLEPGFQLSFAAVASIFVLVPRLRATLEGYPLPGWLRDVIAVSIACAAVTAPILWFQFGSVPLYSPFANVLVTLAVPPLLGIALVGSLVAPILPSAALALALLNGALAAYIALCARLVGSLPSAEIESGPAVALLLGALLALVALLRLPRRSRAVALACAAALVPAALAWALLPQHSVPPPAGLRLTVLDVGQGDAILLQVPEGAILVDQGPPEGRVAEQLRELGIRRLAALVLTHPQRDHVGGAESVLRSVAVERVLDPGLTASGPEHRAALVEARRQRIPVVETRVGDGFRLGRLSLRVLWPDRPGSPADDPNRLALVLLASYGEVDALLTADAETDVTARLLARPVEILKVAHHGSADEGLARELRELRPNVAVISCGRGNPYGHPASATLAALRGRSTLGLYRTDEDGRVVIESDGRRLAVGVGR
jgi:competence protein ComEC